MAQQNFLMLCSNKARHDDSAHNNINESAVCISSGCAYTSQLQLLQEWNASRTQELKLVRVNKNCSILLRAL